MFVEQSAVSSASITQPQQLPTPTKNIFIRYNINFIKLQRLSMSSLLLLFIAVLKMTAPVAEMSTLMR